MKVEVKRVENLLKSNVPVLILAGQDDVILPVAGTLKWVD
jgi:pimeloyl-ACP methyl ester carboxylesterase